MKSPALYRPEQFNKLYNWPAVEIDGEWLPARPHGMYGIRNRLRLAWGVLVGRYDALRWPAGQ